MSHVFTMCPTCGGSMHLNVTDPWKWHEERHPGTSPPETVPEFCVLCFEELNLGEEIITRPLRTNSQTFEGGKRGRIESILLNRDGGRIYVVRLNDGSEMRLPRIAITSIAWADIVEPRVQRPTGDKS